MLNNHNQGRLGEEYVKEYLENHGYKKVDYAKTTNGCDLLAYKTKTSKPLKIEVKTTKKHIGMPDMFESECKNGRLVADELFIVELTQTNKIKDVFRITKTVFDLYQDKHRTKTMTIVASALKTEIRKNSDKYKIEIN